MNIVNFAIDNELLGARSLGTITHQHLRSALQTYSNTNVSTNFNGSICDLRELNNQNHFTSKLPLILREKEFDLTKTNLNKIFTAQWLDERKVIMGTKCNKIVLLDTLTGKHSIQAPLKSHRNSRNIQNHCGIHSISINPSRTLLATGAEHVNDIAIYSLPSMEPVSVGYSAHNYWIFDIVWLDDEHVVSGAGDNKLALWTMNSNDANSSQTENVLSKAKGSFINQKKLSSSSPGTSSSMPNSFCGSSSSFSPSNRPILNRSWSSYNLRNLKQNTRYDRRPIKRPSPSSPSSSIMSTNRFRSPIVARSPYFHNFYSSNSPRTIRASTSASNFSQNVPASLTQTNNLPSSSSNTSGNYRHRFNFRFDSSQQTTSIYNINGNRSSSNRGFSNGQSRLNVVNSGIILRNSIPRDIVLDDLQGDDNFNQINDNDVNDDDEEEDNENDLADDSFTSTNLDENNEFEESFEMMIDENETSLTQSSINNDDDDEQEDSDDDFTHPADHDLNEDEEIFEYNKRRRLNSLGGFQASQGVRYMKPFKVIKCKQSKRIRALAYNPRRNEIAAISMNAAFHYFDVNRFEQKYTKRLSPLKENVCLTINDDYDIYAIGSASHVQLLDADSARPLTTPIFIKKDIGVRSLHFRNNVLSIGTGIGTVLFYDVRAHKFLNKNNTCDNSLKLQTTGGWILRNETYYDTLPYAFNTDNSHAIYSHSYDPTGTKLLTVGGPLTVNLYGHYAGLWS